MQHRHLLVFVSIYLYQLALCWPSNQTLEPIEKTGWSSAPNYRGTFDIIWICVFTIFLCCWTTIHLNIPAPGTSWKKCWLDQIFCPPIGIVAPEVFAYLALCEWCDVKNTCTEPPFVLSHDEWGMPYRFYSSMGGFCIRWTQSPEPGDQEFYSIPIGTLHDALQNGWIDTDSLPSVKDILDKGKADGLLKTITLIQVLWMVIQSITRESQQLPLTTLEISTLAYIPCSMLALAFWWHKPYNIGTPTLVRLSYRWTARESPTLKLVHYRTYDMARRCLEEGLRDSVEGLINRYGAYPAVMFLVVGAIHLAAWNLHFPSTFEQWAWRVSSLAISICIPAAWILARIVYLVSGKFSAKITFWIHLFGVGLYAIARLYLLIEAFVGLRAVPKDAYKTPEWTNIIPHVR